AASGAVSASGKDGVFPSPPLSPKGGPMAPSCPRICPRQSLPAHGHILETCPNCPKSCPNERMFPVPELSHTLNETIRSHRRSYPQDGARMPGKSEARQIEEMRAYVEELSGLDMSHIRRLEDFTGCLGRGWAKPAADPQDAQEMRTQRGRSGWTSHHGRRPTARR